MHIHTHITPILTLRHMIVKDQHPRFSNHFQRSSLLKLKRSSQQPIGLLFSMAKRNHHLLPCLTTKKIVRHGTSSGTRHMNHLDLVASPYLFGSAACCLELWTKGIHILQVGKPLGDTNWLFNWLFPNHMIDPQA